MPLPEEIIAVDRPPTRGLIAAQLRELIVTGALAPGEALRDLTLAERFGVSRTPVREALLELERDGLIESKPQGWTRVAPLDLARFADTHAVWVELHVLGARLVAARADRDLDEIERTHARLAEMVSVHTEVPARDPLFSVAEADDVFHAAVIRASGNQALETTLRPLSVLIRRYQFALVDAFTYGIGASSVGQHEQLIEAFRNGDVERAAEVMRANTMTAFPTALHEPP